MAPDEEFHLHTYFRSSCSARIRIAAALKGIPLQYSYIHLVKGEQSSAEYSRLNPSASVPTLTFTDKEGNQTIITQSIAILEFLEEHFNTPQSFPLLPPRTNPLARAKVRELVNIIACDVQPPTNLRILQRVKALNGDSTKWGKELMLAGLMAFDKVAEKCAEFYSVGDEITMADVVLAPAVEGALRFAVELEKVPTVKKVYEKIKEVEAFKKGDWRHQDDTPDEFRVGE